MLSSAKYHFYKLISAVVCLLPYSLVLFIGKQLGKLYYHGAGRQRERALRQIQERLGLSPAAAEQIVRRFFMKLGQTLLEVLYLPKLTTSNISHYVTIENRHYLEQAQAGGTGVIVLAAHLGNWEWLGAGLALYGFPVASIVKSQPNEIYTRLINEFRRQAGIELFTRGTTQLIGAAKALKRGKILAFFADQDGGSEGIFIDFLGIKSSTHAGAAVFAQKFQLPVVPAFIVRSDQGGHKILLGEPFYFEPSQTIASFTQQLALVIEQKIREYPDEWLWFQKRWNTEYSGDHKEGDT
jgi:KDO2-lipid IV(A) lauroyltransferase